MEQNVNTTPGGRSIWQFPEETPQTTARGMMGQQPMRNMPQLTARRSPQLDGREMPEALAEATGRFIQVWFLIGTSAMQSAMGILETVGNSFLTLNDPCTNVKTTFDFYSLKAWSVYPAGMPNISEYCGTRMTRDNTMMPQ